MIAEFMEDLYDCETIETPYGFISFKHDFESSSFFVQHFYTRREYRSKKMAYHLWNALVEVCQKREIKMVEAIIDLQYKDGAKKLLVFSRVGFEPIQAINDDILVQNRAIKKFGSGDIDG